MFEPQHNNQQSTIDIRHSTFHSRPAFTLTEVMFAVVILGIGFILIAGMFPVMISQSKTTIEETVAAATARSAFAFSSRIADGGDTSVVVGSTLYPLMPATNLLVSPPATTDAASAATTDLTSAGITIAAGQQYLLPGKVLAFDDLRLEVGGSPDYRRNLWNSIRGSLVLPSDNRFAWVPMYRRDCSYYNPSTTSQQLIASNLANFTKIEAPFATIYFVPVSVKNRSIYDSSALATNPDTPAITVPPVQANLSPRPVGVYILADTTSTSPSGYLMNFVQPPVPNPLAPTLAMTPDNTDAVAEGAFVIVSDDRETGSMNGKVFRVGRQRADLGPTAWEVAVGSGTPFDEGVPRIPLSTTTPAIALIVGRNKAAGAVEGSTQDVGVYVTFVKCN